VSLHNLYLIGSCISLDEHPTFRDTLIVQFSDPNFDWDDFVLTCSNHLVIPVIFLKFRKYDLLDHLPEGLASHLEEIYSLNHTRNEQILLQMKEINATLNKAGISPIYLKGTGNLIDGIYSDIGERIIGDIDLLVPDNVFLKSVEMAKEIGYINYSEDPRSPEKLKHYPGLSKADAPANIEIHRLPVIPGYIKYFNSEMVFDQKTTIAKLPGCFVQSNEHKVIQNFIHSQLSNGGHRIGLVTLRDIYDLYCFTKQVDLNQVLVITPYRQKFITWLIISERLLNISGSLYTGEKIHMRWYLLKHNLNYSSALFFKVNRLTWLLTQGIGFVFKRTIESLSDSNLLLNDLRNIVKPEWHKRNINICLEFYRGKK
jgi:hypothetical protein